MCEDRSDFVVKSIAWEAASAIPAFPGIPKAFVWPNQDPKDPNCLMHVSSSPTSTAGISREEKKACMRAKDT